MIRSVFRNIFWMGGHRQRVQISVHGTYGEPKEANTFDNKKSIQHSEWRGNLSLNTSLIIIFFKNSN